MSTQKERDQKRRNYHKHKAKYLAQKKRKWLSDPIFRQKQRDYKKKWRIENPEKYRSKGLRVRFDILNSFGFTCQYCGRKAPDIILEVDHIIPVSKGGSNKKENLTVACKDCNEGKSNRLLK